MNDLTTHACNDNRYMPVKQIIKRKVDPERLTCEYYSQVKRSIKKRIKIDTELLIIEIIPKTTITEKWVVDCLLSLQREFTSIIAIPKNTVDMKKEEIEEFETVFNCSILRS
jgi:hypothetical protein